MIPPNSQSSSKLIATLSICSGVIATLYAFLAPAFLPEGGRPVEGLGSLAVLLLVILSIAGCMLASPRGKDIPHTPAMTRSRAQHAWLLGAVATLLLARFFLWIDISPLELHGEGQIAMENAFRLLDSLRSVGLIETFRHSLTIYNLGISWLMLPVCLAGAGYHLLAFRAVTAIYWAVWLVLLAHLYLKLRRPAPGFILLPALCMATLLVSLRRYKWHGTCLSAVAGLYLVAYGIENTKKKALPICLGALIYILSVYFYHGNLIYLPPFAAWLTYRAMRQRSTSPSRSLHFLVALTSLAALGIGIWVWHSGMIASRFQTQLWMDFRPGSQWQKYVENWGVSLPALFLHFTWPMLAVILLGIAASVKRTIREPGDWFAGLSLGILMWSVVGQLATEGLDNPDWHCWSLLALAAIAVVGLEEIFDILCRLTRRSVAVIILGAICAAILIGEWGAYPNLDLRQRHGTSYPSNTTAQAVLALMTIRAEADRTDIVDYMPSERLSVEEGGFKYETTLKRTDLGPALARVRLFDSYPELVRELEQRARTTPNSALQARVWLSVPTPGSATVDPLSNISTPGLSHALQVTTPLAGRFVEPFPLRVIDIRSTPSVGASTPPQPRILRRGPIP